MIELVCPAGNFPALKEAVNNGADAVYIGFKDDTNARHFAGLNFNEKSLPKAIDYAHQRGTKVFVAINTYPQPEGWSRWQKAVDMAADLGVDALIMADIGILDYAMNQHPQVSRHLSVQGSATSYESLRYYQQNFGIKRAVLPRVLSVSQVAHLATQSPVELEVFGFGSLCVMVEGRCALSSYVTGESPNTCGVCSPAKAVRWEETPQGRQSRLNGVLIDSYQKDEAAGYPTLCKGRFKVKGDVVTIYPSYGDNGYRVHFFGDEIEEIETFHLENNEIEEELDRNKELQELRKAIKMRAGSDQVLDLCSKFSTFVKAHPIFTTIALGVFGAGIARRH